MRKLIAAINMTLDGFCDHTAGIADEELHQHYTDLIDEYQLCVHPVILGKGLPLFKNINDSIILRLLKTKTFSSGSIILCYEPTKK